MPRKSSNVAIQCEYFRWLLGRRNGVYSADGRTNQRDLGRHSLGTRDRDEAVEALKQLDLVKAVECGLADRSVLSRAIPNRLGLQEGWEQYQEYLKRPEVAGGVGAKTVQRYRAVFDKFTQFVALRGVQYWDQLDDRLANAYLADLAEKEYADNTLYLEGTVLKQIMGRLAEEGLIPSDCLFRLPLRKIEETTTYCWRPEEVSAMLNHCRQSTRLEWHRNLIVILSRTGLRISEAAFLRWSDVDFGRKIIRITNSPRRARCTSYARRRTKNRADRTFPIHPELLAVLQRIQRSTDGLVLHGPRGGKLKPDTARNILVRDVIQPLAACFPAPEGEIGFANGRLHSFRHFFCSQCANQGVPERMVSGWLGHKDSNMINIYYHMHDADAQRQMLNVEFGGGIDGDGAVVTSPTVPEASPDGPANREAS